MLQQVSVQGLLTARPVSRDRCALPAQPQHTLDAHLSRSPLRPLEAKEHLFTEGDVRSHLYLVEAGVVCLYKVLPDGRRQVLGFAYPGDLVGLGPTGEHQFNAQATQPSRVRSMSWGTVQQVARHDPSLGIKLYEMISQELAAAHDLLLTTGQRTAIERVAAFLLAMVNRSRRRGGDPAIIDLPMTRSDIGDFLGLTIETVSRTFTKLRHLEIIDLAQCNRVRVLDMKALERVAEGGSER